MQSSQTTDPSDPEAGLVQWIDAVNRQDYDRLYNLMPVYARTGISREDFIALNRNSSIVANNISLTGYDVLSKESDSMHATLKVVLHGKVPTVTSTSSSYVPIGMNFDLDFEDGEWKIWEVP